MKKDVLFKTPQYETDFKTLCENQYKYINGLMGLIEQEFDTSMHEHPELRHRILDISNFIRRLPSFISEVFDYEN
jgi:hypothetical protein